MGLPFIVKQYLQQEVTLIHRLGVLLQLMIHIASFTPRGSFQGSDYKVRKSPKFWPNRFAIRMLSLILSRTWQ